jgi:hypothetical protein
MMGRHVLDCGHPPARTEIHPPEAVAFTRPSQIGFVGNSAYNFTNTYIYIYGHGGYYNSPIGRKNYEFDIPLSPKPPFIAEPYASAKVLFGNVKPILTILNPPNSTQEPKVHVLYNLSSITPSIDNKFGAIVSTGWIGKGLEQNFQTLYVTFDSIKINKDHDPGLCPSQLHPLNRCPGDWKLWVDVNGNWTDLLGGDISNPRSHTTVSDEKGKNTLNIGRTIKAAVLSKGTLTIRTTGWESDTIDNIFGSVCPKIQACIRTVEVMNPNDLIGITAKTFTASQNFGIGTHNDSSTLDTALEEDELPRNYTREQTNADFILSYHISNTTGTS